MVKKILFLVLVLFFSMGVVSAKSVVVETVDLKEEYIYCKIPQISGMKNTVTQKKLNDFLKAQIQPDLVEFRKSVVETKALTTMPAEVKSYSFESSYKVKMLNDELLSVVQQEYWFTGGAHGMALLLAANINLKTGEIYTLDQVFKKNSDWRLRLETFISKTIANGQHNDGYDFKKIANLSQFYFIEEGLVIYFQPYEIGPWVLGMPKFVVPWVEIADILQENIYLY